MFLQNGVSYRQADQAPGLIVDRFKAFVGQGMVKDVRLLAVGKGFAMLVELPSGSCWLHAEKSGKRRIFAKVETALRLVVDSGLDRINGVDLSPWNKD